MKAKEQIRKSSSRNVKEEDLHQDLERFRQMALELGADEAEVIPASHVVVQERVWLKCLVPRCMGAGGTPHCPPNTPQPEFMRKVFSQYKWAVLIYRRIESFKDYVLSEDTTQKERKEFLKPEAREPYHAQTFEIVGRLESYIQGRGYDLAMGFSGGSCRGSLCRMAPCGVLENEGCRFPLRARPSMEAVGIDVFGLAEKVGWNIYMIRREEPDLSVIPGAASMAVIFVY